jgi:hypothetical protein
MTEKGLGEDREGSTTRTEAPAPRPPSPEKVLAGFYKSVADAQAVMHAEFRKIASMAPAVNKARMFQLANILEYLADGRRYGPHEIRLEARWLRTVAETLR